MEEISAASSYLAVPVVCGLDLGLEQHVGPVEAAEMRHLVHTGLREGPASATGTTPRLSHGSLTGPVLIGVEG